MDHFHYRKGCLYAENINLKDIVRQYGTPCYVYSRAALERHWRAFDEALKNWEHLVCYAVKANSNLSVLKLLAGLGSGFDIVSGGELERVLRAGGDPGKTVFSGVGKTEAEIRFALDKGIYCFNVESEAELYRISQIAGEMKKTAPVSVRINPDVDAQTHPYISTGLKENKFGIHAGDVLGVFRKAVALPHLQVTGIDCHIGSQLTDTAPFIDALKRVLKFTGELEAAGIHLEHLDLGGGLGVRYRSEMPPDPREYAAALGKILAGHKYKVLIEPGRAIAANAGILLTKVEYLKPAGNKNFAIVDAAMNDLLRPALYQAWQEIIPICPRHDVKAKIWDVVGPICETGDFLGKERLLALAEGDIVAVRSAGAYGFAMSSNYNTRPRAAEILVDDNKTKLIRRRETIDDLLVMESLPEME